MYNTNKIIANTGILYVRLMLCIFVGLFTTRLVLNALGASDFGIFSLVGSFITMLAFLNGAMSISSQRFLSYALGRNQGSELQDTFKTAKILHFIIGVFVFVLLEAVGPFLFNCYLNIPFGRSEAVTIVYHCITFSTLFTIISVPFDGLINAYENMSLIAVISLIEAIFKFIGAFLLFHVDCDRLVFWGFLTAGVSIVSLLFKRLFCSFKYKQATGKAFFSRKIFITMLSFTLYNTFSTLSGIAKNSGVAVILNMFFAAVVNAAYGIANQVNAQILNFSTLLMKAVTPQIVKSEGSSNRERALRLSESSCKFSFLLICVFAFPIIANASFILNLWLKDVPLGTVIFCQLFLILSMVGQITLPLFHFVQAIGNIRGYQISLGLLQLLNLPLVYWLCRMKCEPYFAVLSTIFIEILAGGLRIFFAHKNGGLNTVSFLHSTIFPIVLPIGSAFLIVFYFDRCVQTSWAFLLLSSIISEILICLFAWFVFFSEDEKKILNSVMTKIRKKLHFA